MIPHQYPSPRQASDKVTSPASDILPNVSFGSRSVTPVHETAGKISKSCQYIYVSSTPPASSPEKYQFRSMIFIGRFQPPHKGHLQVISEMSKRTGHLVIVFGSANEEKTIKNPYNVQQRRAMMNMSLWEFRAQNPSMKFSFIDMPDFESDEKWNKELKVRVEKIYTGSNEKVLPVEHKPAIAGCQKDESTTNYLTRLSDQSGFSLQTLPPLKNNGNVVNATDLRKILFDKSLNAKMSESDQLLLSSSIPPLTLEWINSNLQLLKDCK